MSRIIQGSVVLAPSAARFERESNHNPGARRSKYVADERIDNLVREAYRRRVEENERQASRWAQRETGWPKFMINRRGAQLGLARTKEPNWSTGELAILEENAHLGIGAVRKRLANAGFRRTDTGILLKRKRLKLIACLDGYSGNALARLLGVDNHKVHQWIEDGILPAERRGTDRSHKQGGDMYWIRRADVFAFLIEHPDEYDLHKVEKWWFLSLITGGRISR